MTEIDAHRSNNVEALAINDSGEVAELYVDSGDYGFVRAADGSIKRFYLKGYRGIFHIGGINEKGDVTGSVLGAGGYTSHGFIRTP